MSQSSDVLFSPVPDARPSTWAKAATRLLEHAGLANVISKNDRVAIKVHVGEPPLKTSLPPEVAGAVARIVRESGGHPFLTDTAVLYSGPRSNGVGHAEVAAARGFNLERGGAVFIPADGLAGNREVEIPIAGRHFETVGIAEAIASANAAIAVSHLTGHMLSGFGGTLKNIGMGCASRKGKLLQHSDTKPFVKGGCTACALCVEFCPTGAIRLDGNGQARIDEPACTGCGECLARCSSGAIGFRWDSGSAFMQEKMVEHAMGTMRALKGKLVCLLGLVNLTQHCDCWGEGSPRIAADIGFALSRDPVALDSAALDLVASAAGRALDRLAWPDLDGTLQLSYAESLGLGTRSYRLVEV